jgi:uncharacterized protein (UPF0332 family)
MPSRADHIDQANRNRAHAMRLLNEWGSDRAALEWAVTAAFYSAVHCIEAFLAEFGIHSNDHRDRAFHIRGAPDDLYIAYSSLYDASRRTRYRMACPPREQIETIYLGVYLDAIYSTLDIRR